MLIIGMGADLKFYYCKIWNDSQLVRDFIPVIDTNNKICLYDKVEQKLYYAQYGEKQEEFERNASMLPLKSIACNGNQYIDTELKPNQNTVVEMKCKIDNTETSQALFGSRTGLKTKTFASFYANNNTIRCDYNTVQTNIGTLPAEEFTIKQDKNVFYLNKVQKGSTIYNNFNGDYNLYLLATNTSGTVELKAMLQFYYCKIWDGTNLLRDYIPIMDEAGKIHLYDKVNLKFYDSKGKEFLLGGKEKR